MTMKTRTTKTITTKKTTMNTTITKTTTTKTTTTTTKTTTTKTTTTKTMTMKTTTTTIKTTTTNIFFRVNIFQRLFFSELKIFSATIPQPPWVGRGKINYYFVKIGSPLLQTFGSPRRIGNDKDVEVNDESDDE